MSSDPQLFPALDVRVGRIRVRCHDAATEDPRTGAAAAGLMQPGDLLLQVKGLAIFLVVPAADREALARAIAPAPVLGGAS